MTKPWQPSGEWAGETVAVLASGQNMSVEVADALRHHRTIAVNFAIRAAPWADMLVALDGNWPQELRDFEGIRVTGIVDDTLDALYVGMVYETVIFDSGEVVTFRNSGLHAIRVAAAMGASRIILAGFNPLHPGHFYDDEVDTGEYVGVYHGLQKITAELTARGIKVETYEAD